MPADVILLPVHNRRDVTRAALAALRADRVTDWATVLVIDDGSTDGTGEAVRREFPEIEVLPGDGTWWWGGAIQRGMEWGRARGAERIFWLNDDCRVPAGGLAALRDLVREQSCAAWIDAVTPSGWSYGGHRKTAWGVRRCTAEEDAHDAADTFSGNCVCLPAGWIDRVGLVDDRAFPHGLADLDYGFRLRAAGAALRRLPGVVAENGEPSPAARERWRTSARPMRAIWHDFRSPRSFFYFPAWRRFALRHWGPLWGCAVFVAPYARWAAIAAARVMSPSARGASPR